MIEQIQFRQSKYPHPSGHSSIIWISSSEQNANYHSLSLKQTNQDCFFFSFSQSSKSFSLFPIKTHDFIEILHLIAIYFRSNQFQKKTKIVYELINR